MKLSRSYMVTLLIAFLASSVLTGCSFYTNFFVLNTTDREVVALVKLPILVSKAVGDSSYIKLKYADIVLAVDDETEEKLTGKLVYKQIDSTTFAITIPAKSTVLMGGARSSFFAADSITFVKGNVKAGYSRDEIYKKTEKNGGMFPPFHFTWKIE